MERMSAEDIHAALAVLRPLFGDAAVVESQEETASGGLLRLRSETFLLETPEGDRPAALEVAGGSLERLREMLYLDELTHVFNRRYLDAFGFLDRDAVQDAHPVGLIMLDLRQFKQINDSRGHLAGDQILRDVAEALRAHAQAPNSVIRLGGDEFLVMLPACTEEDVHHKMEELRQAVEAITPADFGCAYDGSFDATRAGLDKLVDTADRRMYGEKRRRTAEALTMGSGDAADCPRCGGKV